jgi:hypothetical protein
VAPADRLSTALGALAAGYTFDTTITVGGKQATHAHGRTLGDASDFVVESNGAAITYRTVPPRSWVLQPGKAWVAVDSGAPDGNPLDALRRPTSVTASADGQLQATYPASALGLTGTDPVMVALTLASDGSVQARYTARTASGDATSQTTLTPAPAQQPIVAP